MPFPRRPSTPYPRGEDQAVSSLSSIPEDETTDPPRDHVPFYVQATPSSSPSSTPCSSSPDDSTFSEDYRPNLSKMPAAIRPKLDPLVSPSVLIQYMKPTPTENNDEEEQTHGQDDTVEGVRQGLEGLETTTPTEPDVRKEDYAIPLDGDHRELARTLMIKMLRTNLGALHPEKIQRKNEMINEVMLYSWDKAVAVTLWNLSRANPFTNQNSLTMYLDKLWDGFRTMFLDICSHAKAHLDFAEAVCRFLYQTQHSMVTMELKFLDFYAKVYHLTGHGFYLLNYSQFRDSIGEPLGVHREYALMNREKVPKIQADFVLMMLNNENFDSPGDVQLPMEIIEAAGLLVRILHQSQEKPHVRDSNVIILDHVARNIFSVDRQKIDMLVTAAERMFGIDLFPAPDSDIALIMRAMVVKSSPMGLWDMTLGDNFVRFRIQFLLAMRDKERLPDASKKSLEAYLKKLDRKKKLAVCCEVTPVDEPEDPQNLPRKVGEHPEVIIMLLILHAYFRHGERQKGKRPSASVSADPTILNLLWWVFVKEAYQRAGADTAYLRTTTKLFSKHEDWLLPLVKEHWDADPRRGADILMCWFATGLDRHGLIVRHADQNKHKALRQIYEHQLGIEFPLELLKYGNASNPVPIYEPVKDRVTVSAFSVLYYLVKEGQLFHNQEVIETVIRTLANTFTCPEYYLDPEERRPKGFYGMYKMGMEILSTTPHAVFEKAIKRCRAELHILSIQETTSLLVKNSEQHAASMMQPDTDAQDVRAAIAASIRSLNDSLTSLRNLLEFIIICAPRETVLRMRLRRRAVVVPLCTLVTFFTEKPDISSVPRGAPRPTALFAKVPAGSRVSLGHFLQTSAKFLDMLFKGWPDEDQLSEEMMEQRELVLNLATEADVAGDMVLKMDRAGHRGGYTV
ncbi:hypothetical protein TWF696_003246 [Orbilia brochopaga]|uniref:Uncharacterized protein n=1 Tax=Orbilia brochopaga TaxID=3140254 RepID=A0AAV9TZG8_9PEZI